MIHILSLTKIHHCVQEIVCGNAILVKISHFSAGVTSKIRSRSPKKTLSTLSPSQQCIHASLVKIHQLVQKKEAMRAGTPSVSTSKPICPPTQLGDHGFFCLLRGQKFSPIHSGIKEIFFPILKKKIHIFKKKFFFFLRYGFLFSHHTHTHKLHDENLLPLHLISPNLMAIVFM